MIIKLLISTLAVIITAYVLPGIVVENILAAIVVAIILGIVNTLLKPILIILTLPINILTLGLFTFIINGAIVLLTSSIVHGFHVKNLLWAILFSIIISLVSSFLNALSK